MENQELTLEKIINFALKNNISFEAYTNCRENTYHWDTEARFDKGDTFIGLELKKDIWFWWSSVNYFSANITSTLDFDHRYNRNNGAIQKTWIKGWHAAQTILNN